MSIIYEPTSAASPSAPWNITILSQRDAAAQIPINYVSVPGVSATAACFGFNRFEENAFRKCILNLLATSFHRLIFDVYWDSRQQSWTFCPSEIPLPQGEEKTVDTSNTGSTQQSSISSIGVRDISFITAFPSTATHTLELPDERRGNSAVLTSLGPSVLPTLTTKAQQQTTITVSTVTASGTVLASYPPAPSTSNLEVLYSIGPYICSSSINLSVLVDAMYHYLVQSDNTLDATIQFLIFNLHVASSNASPEAPAANLSSSATEGLPDTFSSSFSNISSYIYTPTLLANQRANLNSSWLESNATLPDVLYYTTKQSAPDNTTLTTDNGWPNGAFMAVRDNERVLLSFGDIDDQLGGPENFAGETTIFQQGALTNVINTTISSDGTIIEGCIFNANEPTVQAANASWAFATDNSLLTAATTEPHYLAAYSLSKCGISPILNTTLGNQTADLDIGPYQEFIYSSTWSWAPGQPQSPAPNSGDDNDGNSENYRCAVFDSTYNGSWHVESCRTNLRAACRSVSHPFVWSISDTGSSYSMVVNNCPTNYSFQVPRTPTENQYLLQAFKAASLQSHEMIWINFNSLDAESCWVIGVNSTCPYLIDRSTSEVYIPTIAALIILIIASLTVFAKISTNRARSKRRRRVLDGWNYEGVPS